MTAAMLPIVLALLTAALALTLWRLVLGPGWPDRILALDTLYIDATALLVVLGIRFDSAIYFEAALVIALLGFAGTVTLAKFVLRRDVIE